MHFCLMDIDPLTSVLGAKQSATLQAAQLRVLKKEHEMQMALVEMIAQTVTPAPPPGQGARVDKTA